MEKRVQINTSIFLSIDLIGKLECGPYWEGKEHSHHFWEIVLVQDASDNITVSLIKPNEPHSFRNRSNTVSHILYIGFRFNSSHDPDITAQRIGKMLDSSDNFETYASFFRGIGYAENEVDGELLSGVFAFLTRILGEFITDGNADKHHSIVSKIKKYIGINLDKPLTVQQIATTLYLSPKYIGIVFKKETGMGILQYQKAKKMEKALVYLKSGEYSVTEISSLLGFKNVNYFSNTFKGYYGLSPANFSGIQDRKNL